MTARKNIFRASNPAHLSEALWRVLLDVHRMSGMPADLGPDFADDIIFLPSRRAARRVEKMIVEKASARARDAAVIMPRLVALGEGAEDDDADEAGVIGVVSNIERTIVLAKMLAAQTGGGMAGTMDVAKDLIRMADYLENERPAHGAPEIDWRALVDDRHAEHFQQKVALLGLASHALPAIFRGRETEAQRRNRRIREWIGQLGRGARAARNVIVCGSTGSVPATAELMEYVAGLENGHIILPGKPDSAAGANLCGPYYSELRFLERAGVAPGAVQVIDTGDSAIDFFNAAFSNDAARGRFPDDMPHPVRIDCAREAEEAEVAAEIAGAAAASGRTVLIVTPDAAGNQRLKESLARRGLDADFSGGIPGAMSPLGRHILNLLDSFGKKGGAGNAAYSVFRKTGLLDALAGAVEGARSDFPDAELTSDDSAAVWDAMRELSDILDRTAMDLSAADLRAVAAAALSRVQLRAPGADDAPVRVLGTMESRMQAADVVILTGLNEGMFPAPGYETPWLPRAIARQIGLPSPERKISLMALDFMILSCMGEVYWTRSKTSGGQETTESRFLSRCSVADVLSRQSGLCEGAGPLSAGERTADYWLGRARARDNMPPDPLNAAAPRPPADRSDVWVTELELLIHNPYAFYAKHILGLRPKDAPDREPDARDFGNLVHGVIEEFAQKSAPDPAAIIDSLDARARAVLEPGSVLCHFWHKRFAEMAPAISRMLDLSAVQHSGAEVLGECIIAGRRVRAKADRIWTIGRAGYVLDIKTGAAPGRRQLAEGNMPQLPLEGHMMLGGGFANSVPRPASVALQFLQLKSNGVRTIEYSGADAGEMINAAVRKAGELFGRYSKNFEPYEYLETSDDKYKAWDDLARR